MKKIVLFLAVIAAVAVAIHSPAAAMSLKAKQVENFIASMGPVNTLTNEIDFQSKADFSTAKEFSPFSLGLESLKANEASAYKKLGQIVKGHGFSSQEDWASTGDAVMLAFIAVKAEQDNPGLTELQEFPPEMLEQMPPETRAQFETTMKMVRAVRAVPPENKTAVTPYLDKIEAAIAGGQPQ